MLKNFAGMLAATLPEQVYAAPYGLENLSSHP